MEPSRFLTRSSMAMFTRPTRDGFSTPPSRSRRVSRRSRRGGRCQGNQDKEEGRKKKPRSYPMLCSIQAKPLSASYLMICLYSYTKYSYYSAFTTFRCFDSLSSSSASVSSSSESWTTFLLSVVSSFTDTNPGPSLPATTEEPTQ